MRRSFFSGAAVVAVAWLSLAASAAAAQSLALTLLHTGGVRGEIEPCG